MNRVLGDFFENLLYKVATFSAHTHTHILSLPHTHILSYLFSRQIFVTIDEYTTIKDLAAVLRIELQLVKDAVSLYCRLGFARKKGYDTLPTVCWALMCMLSAMSL